MNTFSGNYPIEHRAGEIERLHIQSAAMAAKSVAMLERFGTTTGWVRLDIGCRPGGIADLLGARVGPAGRVIGLDRVSPIAQTCHAALTGCRQHLAKPGTAFTMYTLAQVWGHTA